MCLFFLQGFLALLLGWLIPFVTRIKLWKLGFIGNWCFFKFGLAWLRCPCLFCLVTQLAISSAVLECTCHKGRNGTLETQKVGATFPWPFFSVSFTVTNIYWKENFLKSISLIWDPMWIKLWLISSCKHLFLLSVYCSDQMCFWGNNSL